MSNRLPPGGLGLIVLRARDLWLLGLGLVFRLNETDRLTDQPIDGKTDNVNYLVFRPDQLYDLYFFSFNKSDFRVSFSTKYTLLIKQFFCCTHVS